MYQLLYLTFHSIFFLIFVAGNATYKSLCRSVRRSVGRSVRPSVTLYFFRIFSLFEGRYEYFMGVNAPAQVSTAPAQLITAPAQPPATGAVVYTALFFFNMTCPFQTYDISKWIEIQKWAWWHMKDLSKQIDKLMWFLQKNGVISVERWTKTFVLGCSMGNL